MNVSQSFRLALKSLMVSKVRALLTMLGIIIGVAAVIVIVSLGNGMQQYMNAQFEQIGVNLIQVAIYSYGGNREVEPDDMYALAEKYLPHGSCGVVSFELKGGREAAGTFMKHLKLAAIETHVADARTCCLNPASSTHRQMTDKQLAAAGIPAGLVRMSCGLESKQDLIGDIAQALDQVK